MEINEKIEGRILTLELIGRLDTSTYAKLDNVVAKYIDNVDRINFDMQGIEYISSAGLRVILAVHKKIADKEGLHLYNVNEDVLEIFDITGFKDILNLEE